MILYWIFIYKWLIKYNSKLNEWWKIVSNVTSNVEKCICDGLITGGAFYWRSILATSAIVVQFLKTKKKLDLGNRLTVMKCTFSLWCQSNLLLLTLIAMILVAVANSQGLASRLGRGGPPTLSPGSSPGYQKRNLWYV